jgi:hypothetical protein
MRQHRLLTTPIFQGSWLSFCGAMAGALTALGHACDVVDVGGYSGYAFLTNVTEGWTDPGSPTLHSGNVKRTLPAVVELWAEIVRGTESLGVRLDHYWDTEQYRFWKEPIPEETTRRARAVFERVKAAIDAGRPVVLWGLVVPEYGIVTGYGAGHTGAADQGDDDHYLVSTFRHTLGQPETPVHYAALQAKGGLEAIFFGEAIAASNDVDRHALRRALRLAEGAGRIFTFETPRHPIREHQRYVTGPDAYDEWARVLEASKPKTVYYEYNAYVAAVVHEAKGMAAAFLQRLAEKHTGAPQAVPLTQAAEAYRQAEAQLARVVSLFPYADSGEMPIEKCREGRPSCAP